VGQRDRILTQITGVRGWRVRDASFETAGGERIEPVAGYDVPEDAVLVLHMTRRWAPRCAHCLAICGRVHEQLGERRWLDLPWARHRVILAYAPVRLKCRRCGVHAVELLGWADRGQRQSRRLQQQLALDAASMPVSHVAAKYGLSWSTVFRAEHDALARWARAREPRPLRIAGVDEKYLGRRNSQRDKFMTIVSNLDTGEPLWIGRGRGSDTLGRWLDGLDDGAAKALAVMAMDMHDPFAKAVRDRERFGHVAIVHDPFHVMKRAGEALSELRRQVFFRAGPEMRALGRGTRWLVLRSWERSTEEQRADLRRLFSLNGKLARAYQVVEQLRQVLRTPTVDEMRRGLEHVLYRTEKRTNPPMRGLHDSLRRHKDRILALAEHRPPVGRIEALNNNWETLVRRARGYRNHDYLLLKLRFLVANPVRDAGGVTQFLALASGDHAGA
jgi:transposase